MKASEAIEIFEKAKSSGLCTSIRGFARCVGIVPSTIITWQRKPDVEVDKNIVPRLNYVKEEAERKEPEYVDWSAFRREAALRIYCSQKTRSVRDAIEEADRLIEELKKDD